MKIYLLSQCEQADVLADLLRDNDTEDTRDRFLEPQIAFGTVEDGQKWAESSAQNEYDHDVATAVADGDLDHGMTPPNMEWKQHKQATSHPSSTGTYWTAFDHHLEVEYQITEVIVL